MIIIKEKIIRILHLQKIDRWIEKEAGMKEIK